MKDDLFNILQTLDIIEGKLQSNPNSREFQFLLNLKEELERKLHEYLEEK